MSEVVIAIWYYIISILIGLIGYWSIQKIFKGKFKVITYAISKPIGLIIFGYPIWFLSSIKILNFNPNINISVLFYITLSSIFIYQLKEINLINWFKTNKSLLLKIILIEVIGIFLYLLYLYIRAFNPDLSSTEKPMDILMLSSAGKTDFFPFFDPWWSEQLVNYYYYGFYLFAIIIKLANIDYSLGYNLSLGFIFSQTFIISGTVAFYFTKSIKAAVISGLLITLAGNLHYVNCLVQNREKDIINSCYYPKATRILDPAYTINEITSYSFVLGDLHPHVLSIIFFLSSLLLIFLILKNNKINFKYKFLLLALSLSSTAMINFWDFFTLGIIYAITLIIILIRSFKKQKIQLELNKFSNNTLFSKLKPQIKLLFISFLLAISPFLFFSPFFSHFRSPVEGIGFSPEYVSIMQKLGVEIKQYPSSPGFLFGIWGGFWIIFILWIGLKFIKQGKISLNIILLIILFIVANLLIIFTEIFFFKDMFHYVNPNYFRSNTVFKLTYHSWIIMSVITGPLIVIILEKLEELKKLNDKVFTIVDILVSSIIFLVLGAKLIYPFFAVSQFYNPDFNFETKNITLYGSVYVKKNNIADYEVIKWINNNQKKRVVILEAVGSAYTYFGRISSNTGMGNIINWESHQWTWRFRYPENKGSYIDLLKNRQMNHITDVINLRKNDVKTIYESSDSRITKELLLRYKVKYVYIGDLERKNYKINESKFHELGKLVFQHQNSKLFLIE